LEKTRRYHITPVVAGLILGLFIARVVAEATQVPWHPLTLTAMVVASCGAFVWLLRWLDQRGGQSDMLAPAIVLLIYVFWPQRDWNVALVAAAIAIFSWLLNASARIAHRASRVACRVSPLALINILTFLIASAVYLATLQKDILPADSGEFQLLVTQLGILHQPGRPLYTLAGKLFTLLPVGTPALRLNLMSALLAAGTLTLVGSTVRRMISCHSERSEESQLCKTETLRCFAAQGDNGVWGGLAAVLALGSATTFWAQATTANIRMPTAFLTALCLYALAAYRQSRQDRHLLLFALALSLGLGHDLSLVFMGLFFVGYLAMVDPTLIRQPRRWLRPLFVFVLAQLVWLYLPIRAAIAPTPETIGLTNLHGFLWYALGQGFAGDILAFAGPEHLPARLALLPTLFPFQMNLALLAAALASALMLVWRDWRAAILLIGGFLLHTFIAITYRAPQTVEYEMPAYVALAVIVGYGVGQISNIKYQISNVVVASVMVAGLANGVAHAPSFITLAGDRSTREYVEPILRDAPRGAIILSDWHWATPMWYLQQIEGLRRDDVTVRYVFPVGGQEWSQVWRGLIEENVRQRPVIVTHYWGLQYATLPYVFEPFDQAWLVRDKPSFAAPRDLSPLSVEFDGKIRLVGVQTDRTLASPGQPLKLTLALQTIGQLDRDYALTIRLVDANDARRAQQDRPYPTRTFAPGEVRVDRFTLPLEPTLAPGRYAVQVGVYFVPPEGGFRNLKTTDGQEQATVAMLDLVPGHTELPTLHPLDVPFAGGPTLTGVDYDWSNPSSLRVYLHWRGPSAAGLVARVNDSTVMLPELARGAAFVTGHDVPAAAPLRLNVTSADDHTQTGAGAWGWPVSSIELPAFQSSERYVILGDQMLLAGVDVPRRNISPDQLINITLRWLSLKPLVTDNVASVRVEGADGTWRVSSDDHPAGDAFPTLKWIAGSVVQDWRQLSVPADAQPGRASGHLTVYGAFREDILPPLDARMSDSVPLGEWTVER
jgi:hypothetical protein